MGILSSIYTGISGIQGQGEALSIYGDNIANASTVGFKASRPEFQDVIARSIKGVLGGNQIGHGVKLAAINPIFSQGSILQTESPTDLAITGDGFFVMKGHEGTTFSRNGAFHFDKEGALISSDGYKVQGFLADDDGKISSKLSSIAVDRTVIDSQRTSNVRLFMNLDLRAEKTLEFDPKKPDKTSNYATGVVVHDSAGTPHTVTLYFNKDKDGSWIYRAMAKGEETTSGKAKEMVECARGRLNFDTDGRLKEQKIERSVFNFNKGALPDQYIKFDFGDDKSHGGTGVSVTQYGTASETYKTIQDGYTAGTLAGLSFSDEGILTAVYTNGEHVNIAQVGLAKFENPEGLFKLGQNHFRESRLSGSPTIGAPYTGGRGRLSSKNLEASTTDIANEFVNLIQAQRNFQASSKVVSTSDELFQEVLNLKR